MPQYEINVPGSGSYRIDSPSDLTDEQVWQAVQGQIKAAPASTKRTWGETAQDIGAGVVSGAGSLVQLPGQLYGLATGNMEKTGALGLGEDISKYGESLKSTGLKAREAQREKKIQAAEEKGQVSAAGTAFWETLKDPALLVNFLAEQAPQMLIPFGAAKIGKAAALAGTAAKGLAAEEAAAAGIKAGAKAAVGAGAVQQGADVGAQTYDAIYKELISKGADPKDAKDSAINLARASGASGALVSLLAQRLPGAKRLEESFAGAQGGAGRLVNAGKTALGELGNEVVEETGGKFGQNLAMRSVKPEQSLTEGLGRTAGMAAVGGVGMGGVTGAMQKTAPEAPPAPEAAPAPEGPKAMTAADLPMNALIGVQQKLKQMIAAGDTSPGITAKLAEVTQELKNRDVADVTARTEALTTANTAERRAADTEKEAKATEAFTGDTTNMEQMGFRAMEPEGTITGPAATPPKEAPVGLADVISDAGLQGTTEDLRTAGITPPTNKELEAAGQATLGLRRAPAAKPAPKLSDAEREAEHARYVDSETAKALEQEAPIQGKVAPETITAKDLADINIPMKTSKGWLLTNVVGKTPEEVKTLVDKDPTLVQGKDPRAKILQTILKEVANVLPTTPEPVVRVPRSKPSVGVPSQPAGNERGAGLVPSVEPTGKPVQAKPVGLAPVSNDANAGNAPKRPSPAAVNNPFAQLFKPEAANRVEEAPPAAAPAAKSPFDWRGPSTTGTTTAEEEAPASARKKSSIGISTGRTAEELSAELAKDTSRVGRAVQRLIKSGKLKIETKSPTQNEAGNFEGAVATLYADAINEGTAMSVLLHEVGDHMGLEAMLGEKNYKSLPGRIKAMAQSAVASIERTMARKALARVPEGTATDDELSAYFIEEIARAAADGTIPKAGPISTLWRQVKAAFVSAVNRALGTDFGLSDISVRDMLAMAEAVAIRESKGAPKGKTAPSVSKSSISAASKAITAKQTAKIPSQTVPSKTSTDVRTLIADSMASVAEKINTKYKGAVRLGTQLNPLAAMRQAADTSKFVTQFMLDGGFRKDTLTGLYEVFKDPNIKPAAEVFKALERLAKAEGMDVETAKRHASVVLEGVRLDGMRTANRTLGTDFKLHMSDADINTQMATYRSTPILQEISKLMDAPRIQLVNLMEKVGRLTPEAATAWRDVVGYVPFDRATGPADVFTRIKKPSGRGIGQYGKIPELKGSLERPVGDVFDNYVNTISWMLRQVTITDATRTALEDLATMNIGFKRLPGDSTTAKAASTSKVIQEVWIKGEPAYYELPTKYDKMAFADPTPPPTGMVKIASQVSNVLRTTVTALPPFALKQVVDDVQRAVFTSGVKNPAALIGKSLGNFFSIVTSEMMGKQHPLIAKFASKGILGEVDSNHQEASKYLMQTMGLQKRSLASGLMHRLDIITRASDLAVRAAVHTQTLTETGDMLLADTRARELINFRRKGSSQGISTMIATIPFFNAYIQGTDLVYRNAMGLDSSMGISQAAAKKMFAARAAQVFAFSLAYAFMMQDDEDYKKMNLRTRNNNWVVGGGIKIPVPGEYAALFKVTAENLVEYMSRSGTKEELTANDAVMNAMGNIYENFAGRVVPIPQAVKPLMEAFFNHSTLTGRTLEGTHQQILDADQRKSGNTSSLATAIADFTASITKRKVLVSPIMIDNTLDGYFGSSSALVKLMTDSMINPNRADKPIEKWAVLSNFMYETGESAGTRRMDEFYDLNAKTSGAVATMNKLAETDIDAAVKYAEAHVGEISLNKSVQNTIHSLGKMRAAVTFLESENGVAAEPDKEKRAEMIKDLKAAELASVQWVREIKTAMNL